MRAGTDVLFHGVRGSSPVSGRDFAQFGGDTPAVEIASGETRIILDAGSGLRNVACTAADDAHLDIILSHYHYDHLIGFPFLAPAWRGKGRLTLWAPDFGEHAPRDILHGILAPPYCPVGFGDFAMDVDIIPYRPGASWRIGGVGVSTLSADHPGGSASIRLSTRAGDAVYATDMELGANGFLRELADFASGADLVIADAMNDDANAEHRRGWGHSSWREAVELGAMARAKRLALFHHDPAMKDAALEYIEAKANELYDNAFSARQGAVVALTPEPADAL
ncbi:MAG: MBL fold metallo-hydrolase [Parvularculaceae bacterium]